MTMSMSDACRPDPANARLAASDARSAGSNMIRMFKRECQLGEWVRHAGWRVLEEWVIG